MLARVVEALHEYTAHCEVYKHPSIEALCGNEFIYIKYITYAIEHNDKMTYDGG